METLQKILAEYHMELGNWNKKSNTVFVMMKISSALLGEIVSGFHVRADYRGFVKDFTKHALTYNPTAFARSWITSENAQESGATYEGLLAEGEKNKARLLAAAQKLRQVVESGQN